MDDQLQRLKQRQRRMRLPDCVPRLSSTYDFADVTRLTDTYAYIEMTLNSGPGTRKPRLAPPCMDLSVEFYLYPTVGTVLIHSVKPELTE